MVKPIVTTLETGGSGTGLSYYSEVARCPRFAALRDRAGRDITTNKYLLTGQIFHKYMELKDDQGLAEASAVQIVNSADDSLHSSCELEAQRLFHAYLARFPGRDFGDVRGVEWQINSCKEVCNVVGIDPFTCRLDRIDDLTDADCEHLLKEGEVCAGRDDLCAGRWIIDHKTSSYQASNLYTKRLEAMQATAYTLAYEAAHNKECKGVIFNEVIANKVPVLKRIVVPYPSDSQRQALRSFLHGVQNILRDPVLHDWPNAHELNCFPKGRTCPFFDAAICQRF